MGWFIFFIIFAVAGLILGLVGLAQHGDTRYGWIGSGIAVALVGALFLFFGGIRSVPVKSVGVLTSWGHVEGDLTPGFHWEMPWTKANILDETVQTTSWGNTPCSAVKGGTGLTVRIGGQQTACLDATIKWQILDKAAPVLFANYDTSGNVEGTITTSVVQLEFEQVVNQVMGGYNPIQDVSVNGEAGNSQFSTFAPVILRDMRKDIGSEIRVEAVILPYLQYDSSTQSRLNTIQQQYAEAAIAKEQIEVNSLQQQANDAIGNPTGQQLASECYTIVNNAMKANYQLPATFNCSGSTAGVVVNGG